MKLPFAARLLAVAVLAAASAALPLSSAFADDTAAKPKVGLVMKSLANEFFVTMQDGAKAYQKEHAADFDMITNGIKNETDTSAQIDIVNQMILAKVNAIVIAPADSKALVTVLKKASDAGIKVVNIDNRLDPDVLKSKNSRSLLSVRTTEKAPSWWAIIWPSNWRQVTRSASSKGFRPPPTPSSAPQATRMRWTRPA